VLATIAEHMRGADQIPAIAGAAPDESGKQRESVTVMNEVTKIVRDDVDGFDGFEDQIEGEGHLQTGGVIRGLLAKFTNEATWLCSNEEMSPNLELVPIDILRIVQKWGPDQKPIETMVLEPGQKFPDVEAMNEAVPRKEWIEGPSGLRGPWQAQYIVYLVNPATMDRYTFPTGTTGGSIAVRELRDKTVWMRRFRGVHVYPVVTLSDTFMRTRFGGRQRPHFLILRWILLDDGGGKLLPAREASRKTEPAKAVADQAARAVEPPSVSEEMNDALPFNQGDESTNGREALSSPLCRPDALEELIGAIDTAHG